MPYDFTLMRFPRPTQPGLEGPQPGPQPILRGQIRQVLDSMAGLQPGPREWMWQVDPPGGPHIEVHVDFHDPPEFLAVEFDRYNGQADYAAARLVADQLCEALRLTITDDPDATGVQDEPVAEGGFLGKLRGLFAR